MADTNPYTTGELRRDFVEYDHPNGDYTVRAHKVSDKTQGLVLTSDGGTTYASPGTVLVETSRPNVYELHQGGAFDDMELVAVRDQEDLTPDEDVADAAPEFDPNEMKADEVRRYLRRADLSASERNRVILAERNGANRSSAIPAGMDVVETESDDTESDDDSQTVVL